MDDVAFSEAEFLCGWCERCEREVLTGLAADANRVDQRRCVHCDTIVTARLASVAGDELGDRGYALADDGGGCGRADCGGGRCGSSGGAH